MDKKSNQMFGKEYSTVNVEWINRHNRIVIMLEMLKDLEYNGFKPHIAKIIDKNGVFAGFAISDSETNMDKLKDVFADSETFLDESCGEDPELKLKVIGEI